MAYADLPAVDLAAAPPPTCRVGPNAVTQLHAALSDAFTAATADNFFGSVGMAHLAASPPTEMIDAAIPARLFDALWLAYPSSAPEVAWKAGLKTGAYILANRIPAIARWSLHALPASLASPMLLKAIARHAWTFAGDSVCTVRPATPGVPARLSLHGNPLAMPDCTWHRGVFTALFRALVSRDCVIEHVCCEGSGEGVCSFDIHLSRLERPSRKEVR